MTGTLYQFSIIVPVVGQPEALDDTLASILREVPSDSEVFLVHDGTFIDNYNISAELTVIDSGSKRLSTQCAAALEQCTGEIVSVIRPGVELPEGWGPIVTDAFVDSAVSSATPIIVSQSKPDRIVTVGLKTNYHFHRMLVERGSKLAPRVLGRVSCIGPTSWAAFYRRSTLAMIESWDSQIEDQYFDLDIALTLKALGYRNEVLPDCVCQFNRPAIVGREADQPHGQSAQRAIARHVANDSAFRRGWVSFIAEIFMAIWKPGSFQQAVGRLRAPHYKAEDQAFKQRVSQLSRHKLVIEKTGLSVFEEELSADVDRSIRANAQQRRAA